MSIEQRLQALEEKISYIEKNQSEIIGAINDHDSSISGLARMIDLLQENSSSSERMVGTDRVWNCEKCGARLGVYDADSEQLRIKYKDFSLYSVPGKGGSLTVPCRRCAHLNTLEDDR